MCLKKLIHSEIENLANRFYKERDQEQDSALGDWLKAERVVRRVIAGVIYLIIGILVVFASPLVMYFLDIYGIEIFWCIGWSMIGAGAGLINTRNHSQSSKLHLVGYWWFVLLVISIFSFTIPLYISGEYPNLYIKFYSLSALLGLIGGFLSDIFRDLSLKIFEKLNLKIGKG
ncbi:MAG: hypothetical protein WC616_02315 [Candidatus Omnitrophota bacterium]